MTDQPETIVAKRVLELVAKKIQDTKACDKAHASKVAEFAVEGILALSLKKISELESAVRFLIRTLCSFNSPHSIRCIYLNDM